MTTRPIRILFLCTGNACRSQMAESILRFVSGERFEALSAGSHPAGFIHPLAVEALARLDVPMSPEQSSKSWDEFAEQEIDAAITLCDAAASEACPAFAGDLIRAHWSLPDPAYQPGSVEERVEFATRVARRLLAKIEGLVALDWAKQTDDIKRRLDFLAEI